MPSILNVQRNGLAPSGATVGDIIQTAGGSYQVMAPGTPGATYNDASGLWSKKLGDDPLTSLTAYQLGQTEANTARSEAFAQHQMDFQTEANARAMSFSAEEAEKNRQWQERLSNTAHVREVQDLINAGLNPILSANGSGATTPSGASASGITSGGASGLVDTSGAGVMNNLIAGLFQKYVTDTTNANQRFMNDNTLYSQRQVARMTADANLLGTAMNAQAMRDVASTSAFATMYASDNAKQASMYASDSSKEASKYGTDHSFYTSMKGLENSYDIASMKVLADIYSNLYNKSAFGFPVGALALSANETFGISNYGDLLSKYISGLK